MKKKVSSNQKHERYKYLHNARLHLSERDRESHEYQSISKLTEVQSELYIKS